MSHAPCIHGLFDQGPRRTADTSLAAYRAILPTLTERERVVFLALCDHAGPDGLTGAELAEAMGTLRTSTRPRLNGLKRKGWIVELKARKSRADKEGVCHPVVPAVPRAAVERVR